MAIVETIRIDGDTSGIENKIEKLNKSVEGLVDSVQDVGEESKKSFDTMEKETKESTTAVKSADRSLKGFVKSLKVTAVAAAGLGIIKGVLGQTQGAVDLVNTGMNSLTGFINNVTGTVKEEGFFAGISKSLKDAIKNGKELTQLDKDSLIAEVERQKLQLEAQEKEEKQRQIRDDVTKSIKDRIDANDKIATIANEQIEAEKAQIQIQIDAAQARFDNNKKVEDFVALKAKELQLAELSERTTSIESERLANQIALRQEEVDLLRQRNENDAEALLIGQAIKRQTEERIAGEGEDFPLGTAQLEEANVFAKQAEKVYADTLVGRLERERDYFIKSNQLRQDFVNKRIEDLETSGNTENAEYETLLKERFDLEKEYGERTLEFNNKIEVQKIENIRDGFALAANALNSFSQLNKALTEKDEENAEKAFKTTKALQLASAIANTASAVTAQLAVPQDALTGTNFIKAGIALTTGLAQIATIRNSEFGDQARLTPSTITAPSAPLEFNVVGGSGINQLAQTIGSQFDRPIRAYVVGGDILSAQELERRRIRTARFG